ncbi:MAG: CRTAC1 family protein [Terriglobia bacterium]
MAFALLSAAAATTEEKPIVFEEVSQQAGIDYRNLFGTREKPYIIETIGNGAAWLDFDNDGWLDLFVVNGSTLAFQEKGEPGPGNRLYRNNGDGTFSDVTAGSGLVGGYWGCGVAAGDYDNDGWTDLYVTTILEENHLYRNSGDGTFTDITQEAGVGGGGRASSSAAFFDYDLDGALDLYVANYVRFDQVYLDKVSPYCLWKGLQVMCGPVGVPGEADQLYRNNGDGTFTDVTEQAGIGNPELKSLGVLPVDFDEDGWPDLYIASDSTINALYRNRGDGTFEDVTLLSGTGFSQDGRAQAGMGVDAGDYDGDGRLDLFITNFQDDDNTLYRSLGGFTFTETTYLAKLGHVSFDRLGWGTGFRDLDNDGHLDLFIANGHVYPQVGYADLPETYPQQNQVFRSLGNGEFVEVTSTAGSALEEVKGSRGVAFVDYDNDGRLDLVVVNMDDRLSLLHNVTDNDNHWLTIRLIGSKSNRDGLGARLRLKAGERVFVRQVTRAGSYASSNDPRVHFGLGQAATIEWLEVIWPSGTKQRFTEVSVDQLLVVHEEKELTAAQ